MKVISDRSHMTDAFTRAANTGLTDGKHTPSLVPPKLNVRFFFVLFACQDNKRMVMFLFAQV